MNNCILYTHVSSFLMSGHILYVRMYMMYVLICIYVHVCVYTMSCFISGVPEMISNVAVDNSTNGNIVTLTLSWGEPFNNLDPIVNYTVSCSGDVTCPPNFTTTDNTTRSYTITNLKTDAYYVFSVVATNSIGSGEAGVVTIGNPPTTTVAPTTTATVASSVDTSTITSTESTSISMSSQSIIAATSSSIETTTTSSTNMITTASS